MLMSVRTIQPPAPISPAPIVRDPHICGGCPTIAGTRLTCANVVNALRFGSARAFLALHPHIAPGSVRACLAYCAHRGCLGVAAGPFCQGCELDRDQDDGDEAETRQRQWVIASALMERGDVLAEAGA
jgi:uncharacterized protein (DUF433 family)